MKLSCIAVDDEALALELLVDNLAKVPFMDCKAHFSNSIDTLQYLQENKVDLAFLDIQMMGLTGMQLASLIKSKTKVIFLSAYEHHALESYEVNALDYLVKPVRFDRFMQACLKALDSIVHVQHAVPGSDTVQEATTPAFLFVPVEYNLVKITTADIIYIEGYRDYVKIYLRNAGSPIVTRLNMKLLEEKLRQHMVRIHKSYLVSIQYVVSIQRNLLKIGTTDLPISDHYRELLMTQIGRLNMI